MTNIHLKDSILVATITICHFYRAVRNAETINLRFSDEGITLQSLRSVIMTPIDAQPVCFFPYVYLILLFTLCLSNYSVLQSNAICPVPPSLTLFLFSSRWKFALLSINLLGGKTLQSDNDAIRIYIFCMPGIIVYLEIPSCTLFSREEKLATIHMIHSSSCPEFHLVCYDDCREGTYWSLGLNITIFDRGWICT